MGEGGIGMMRLVLPEPTDLTIAGRDAVSSPGDAQTPATVMVALDDGGALMAQVTAMEDVPSDPVAAAVAIAEAAFASGPVLGRPTTTESGPALGYMGEVCDLVTLDELRTATGDEGFSTAQADMPDFCSYSKDDFSGLVTVGLVEGELFRLQSGDWVDLTIAGRPAVWSTEMLNSLNVDIGGGRLLQVGLVLLDGEPERLQDVATSLAETAMDRLTPVEAVGEEAPPAEAAAAGPGCDLVPVQRVAEITGLPFSTASDQGIVDIGCAYSSADQANGYLIVSRSESADAGATVEEFASSVPLAAGASPTQVLGRPAMALSDPSATFVVVDLDGIAGEEGRVLSVVWLGPPQGMDAQAMVLDLAEAAIGGL
jgi:hypothetical protein